MANKALIRSALRSLFPYPAILVPNEFGMWDVYLPNFSKVTASGLNGRIAAASAREALTHALADLLLVGLKVPGPSDPGNLLADGDEPAGSRVIMVEPDRDLLLRRLNLQKKYLRMSPEGERYRP